MTTNRTRPRNPPRRKTATVVANTLGVAHLRERIQAVFEPLIRAALDSAVGVRHVFEQDPTTGQWTRVTDPDQITALLNAPAGGATAHRLILYSQDPDARLCEGLLVFALGAPFDPELFPVLVEGIEVDAETGEMTVHVNEALLAELRQPRPQDPPALAQLRRPRPQDSPEGRGSAPPPPRSRRVH